jgi:signal transduction histidine kinase
LFRIVQTSLTNVHLHSGSNTATIKIDSDAKGLTLTVTDHGRGIPANVLGRFLRFEAAGVGLAGMRERANLLGGQLEFETSESGPMRGTTVKVTIPSSNFRNGAASAAS